MQRYTFVVFTRPLEGQDDAYNEWYSTRHLRDVLALEGFVAAQRFRLVDSGDLPKSEQRYMAIYEAETDNLEVVYQRLRAASGTDDLIVSPALDRSATVSAFYEPITDRLEA
jgi:hypothetical protein